MLIIEEDDIIATKKLRNFFLKPSNYDKYTRPVKPQDKTIKIAFGMVITQIAELVSTSGYLRI